MAVFINKYNYKKTSYTPNTSYTPIQKQLTNLFFNKCSTPKKLNIMKKNQ